MVGVRDQVESMADADKRLDELAATGRLNPALLLLMAKAHAAAKESSYTKEEAKDVMAHLYFKVSMVVAPAPSLQLDGRRGKTQPSIVICKRASCL